MSKGISKDNFIFIWNNIKNLLSKKVDKVEGKGLSTNDLTDELKQKILDAGSSSFNGDYNSLTNKPTNVTTSKDGFMSKEDKVKLDGVAVGAQVNVIDGININGSNAPIISKKVNITVPTKVSQVENDSEYQTATQVEQTISGKGYQTATQVNSIISNKGYQTQEQVNSIIDSKGFETSINVDDKLSLYAKKTDVANAYIYKGSVKAYANLPVTANIGDVYNVEENEKNYAWNGTKWDDLGGIFEVQYCTNEEIQEILNN